MLPVTALHSHMRLAEKVFDQDTAVAQLNATCLRICFEEQELRSLWHQGPREQGRLHLEDASQLFQSLGPSIQLPLWNTRLAQDKGHNLLERALNVCHIDLPKALQHLQCSNLLPQCFLITQNLLCGSDIDL